MMIKTIIILSGGFDPVHKGHVRMFQGAQAFPAHVAVGLNSNSWLIRKKGKPFMDWDERKEILDAVSYIDYVYDFNDADDSACHLIEKVIQKYGDDSNIKIYFGNGGDRTDDNSPEVSYCDEQGVNLLWSVGGEKIQSSSDLIDNSKTLE